MKNHLNGNNSSENVIVKLGKFSIFLLILYYMWFNEKYGHNTSFVYGSFLVMCICLLLDIITYNDTSKLVFHSGIWINFAMVAYSFITGIFIAYNQSYLLENIRVVLQYSMISFATYYFSLKSDDGIDWLLKSINAVAMISCFFLLYQPYEIIPGRFCLSLRDNPNTLGVIFVLGIFSAMYNFKPTIKNTMIVLMEVGLLVYGILMTGSRKSLLVAVVIVIVSLYEIIKDIRHSFQGSQYIMISILTIIILLFSIRYLRDYYMNSRISERIDSMFDEDSIGNRVLFYKKAWDIFLQKPLFGGGLQQFRYWSGTGSYAHSTYAEALADFGLLGCLIYFYPVFTTGVNSFLYVLRADLKNKYKVVLLFIFWVAEILIGIGQIFFLDFVHFLAWTIIFYEISTVGQDQNTVASNRNYKYIIHS